jgi:hypothetical protein
MAILDLQGMQATSEAQRGAHSGASKNCGNHSGFSLLLC